MNYNFLKGEILLINKPYKWTSFDAVNSIKKTIINRTDIKKIKIGHAGTLDPLATGLLIICTGACTKQIQQFQNLEKEYTGTITLGAVTASGDLEKEVILTNDVSNLNENIIIAAVEKFKGEIQQKPPLFSAKKINGIRAYEYARKGDDVNIQSNNVFIKEFDILKIDLPEVHFRIVCSKGTYIRSIAIDLGDELGVGGYLSSLCRTRIGSYKLEDSIEVEEFIKNLNL